MKIKNRVLIAIIAILGLTIVIIKSVACTESYPLYTENIDEYNSTEYPIVSSVFPSSVPMNSKIVAFSYYNYWNEACDIYLELKFDSTEEMEQYIIYVKSNSIEHCRQYNPPKSGEWFVDVTNSFDNSYVDSYLAFHHTIQGESAYTGFTIETSTDGNVYKCNYGIISYSYDELTVIHTYTNGWFREGIHNYTPKYFIRFNVPTGNNYNHLLNLAW